MGDATGLGPPKSVQTSVAEWTDAEDILCKMRRHLRKCLEHSDMTKGSVSFSRPPSLGLADSKRGQGVNAAGHSRCFLLQFKCPSEQMDSSGERPVFSIDARQLRAFKRYPPGSAFYVLPLTADPKRFSRCPSSILDKTCIVDAHDIMPECDSPAENTHITIRIDTDKSAHVFDDLKCYDLNTRPLRCLCDSVASVPKIPVPGFPAGSGGRSDPQDPKMCHQDLLDEQEQRNLDEHIDRDSFGDGKDPDRLLVMRVDFESADAGKGSP